MATMSHADRGAVTAEFAVVLPAVAMVAMVLLCLTRTVTVSMRCQDAASAVVRELVTREAAYRERGCPSTPWRVVSRAKARWRRSLMMVIRYA